jgi:uncharacterized protein YdiU (UPF0061 family)
MWSAVGFCHGLLNTDHMSLVGITLGLGPYSFVDRYLPKHCPSARIMRFMLTYAYISAYVSISQHTSQHTSANV